MVLLRITNSGQLFRSCGFAFVRWMMALSVLNKKTPVVPRGQSLATVVFPQSPSRQPVSGPDQNNRQEGRLRERSSPQRGRTDAKVIPQHVLTLNTGTY